MPLPLPSPVPNLRRKTGALERHRGRQCQSASEADDVTPDGCRGPGSQRTQDGWSERQQTPRWPSAGAQRPGPRSHGGARSQVLCGNLTLQQVLPGEGKTSCKASAKIQHRRADACQRPAGRTHVHAPALAQPQPACPLPQVAHHGPPPTRAGGASLGRVCVTRQWDLEDDSPLIYGLAKEEFSSAGEQRAAPPPPQPQPRISEVHDVALSNRVGITESI